MWEHDTVCFILRSALSCSSCAHKKPPLYSTNTTTFSTWSISPMKQTIRVSRSGLTQCPSCKQHIRLKVDIHQTDCPFCNSSLTGTQTANRPTISLGKKGLMAAAILGVTAAIGCASPTAPAYPKRQPLLSL